MPTRSWPTELPDILIPLSSYNFDKQQRIGAGNPAIPEFVIIDIGCTIGASLSSPACSIVAAYSKGSIQAGSIGYITVGVVADLTMSVIVINIFRGNKGY